MPSIWELLTGRGRFLLIFGICSAAVTVYLGQRSMIFMGLALVLIPLLPVLVLRRSRTDIAVERHVIPTQAPVGSMINVELTVDRNHDLSGGVMLFEDKVPTQLGQRPRFTVHQFGGQPHRVIGYQLQANQRGRYNVGPVSVETRDPFGMVRLLRQQHAGETPIKVTPVISPLNGAVLRGLNGSTGETTPQHISSSGEDDVLVREYRHGDDMRRVHWRSSAKLGELMVRREEQSGGPTATILIDSRHRAHAGSGQNSSFEWSVNAAASIAIHLLEEGYRVCLISAEGTIVEPRSSTEHELAFEDVVGMLTDITLAADSSLATAAEALSQHAGNHVMIALIGSSSHHDLDRILAARHGRTHGIAFILDTPSFTDDKSATEGIALQHRNSRFSGNGWRTVTVTSAMSVPQAWLGIRNLA